MKVLRVISEFSG